MNEILSWLVGGVVAVLSVAVWVLRGQVKGRDETIKEQKVEIAVRTMEKKAVEELKESGEKQSDDEKLAEEEKDATVADVKEAEGKGDKGEAIEIANDIVAGFNSRHEL